ncbi:MAG: hypothetical protein A2Y66_07380 [Nitrospirae bacterium RBG_13_41_22]|nr:MAG: hypothetical protein A2Y66_07380 [Nitrospirae bacterium RBG_13_41_22]
MKKVLYLFLIAFLVLPFEGCKKKQAPVQKPMAEKVQLAEEKQETKESEEVKKFEKEEYTYDAKGRRDPFLSLVTIPKQKLTKKKGASPIESYDISEIKLLAIAWDKEKYYALVMLPDRKSYTITEGKSLGLQDGKVITITRDTVIIREHVKDYKGDIKPRDIILKLHEGEEE